MDQHRGLSPDDTMLLLRDLLTAYDPAFEPMKMSRISGLECAIVCKTGEYIWAHRDEIEARKPDLQFRHDYTATSPVAADQQETKPLWPEPSGPLPVLEPSRGMPVVAARASVMMQICESQNLRTTRKFGRLSPYCKWSLVSATGVELASGRTPSHDRADWSGVTFSLRNSDKAATLNGCVLLFSVKARTLIPGIK